MSTPRAKIFLLSVLLLFMACGPTRNTYLNRKYQSLLARDNGYFNARKKLRDGLVTLKASHTDDHTRVLDVFPYAGEKEAKPLQTTMDEVYKKCSNVIQKRPISSWVDDSYMLIGQSHFFKRDYFAALETFQYIISRYKNKNPVLCKEAEIWIVKCYLYLNKPGEAEAVVSLMLGEKDFPKQHLGFLHATAAAVYIRQEKYSSAQVQMKKEMQYVKGKEDKIRYNYILGQLEENSGNNRLAIFYYKQVIKRTPPYQFEFNAKLSIARLYNPKDKNASKQVRRYFRRLLRDDKNIDYFDQVYYELGNLEYRDKNLPEAIKNYKLSIQKSKNNQKQKALSYYALAKLYFGQPEYVLAQAYYDTLSQVMPTDFPNYKKIMDTRLVLSDLIKNITIINTEDSLQAMAKLSPEALEKKINDIIERDKQQKLLEAKNKKKKQEQANNEVPVNPGQRPGAIGAWYFDNPVSLSQGKTDFTRKWGDRKLEDFWRLSSREKTLEFENGADSLQKDSSKVKKEQKEEDLIANVPVDKKKFYANLPTTSTALRESNARIQEAYYNLGSIYEDKLNDTKEAVKAFETLLKRFPGSKNEPEVYYRLYKLNKEAGNKVEAEKYKKLLVDKYPASDYALIVTDKWKADRDKNQNKELEIFYESTYEQYQAHNCDEVYKRVSESNRLFPGSVLEPKFGFLRALCTGRSITQDSFKVVLQGVIDNFPGTDVAKNAKEIIDAMKTLADRLVQDSIRAAQPKKDTVVAKTKTFDFSGIDEKHFYVVVLPVSVPIGNVKIMVSDYNKEAHSTEPLQVSALLLNEESQLFVVKEFPNDRKAMSYLKEFDENNRIYKDLGLKDYTHFIISAANFVKLLRSKNLPEYLENYKQKFN